MRYVLVMLEATSTGTMDPELNDADREILVEIRDNGRATTTLLADEVDVSRTYAAQRIKRLREHEFLTEVAPRLYDITEAGEQKLDE